MKVDRFVAHPKRQVFFFDEGRFGLQHQIGRCWTLKGKKASVTVKPGYTNFYIYACVSPFDGRHFSLFLPHVNAQAFSLYLAELASAFPEQEILIIMDQAGWHKAKDLDIPKTIRFEFLPPYSPELNPVERLWQWLRRHACRNRLFRSEDQLMDELQGHLRSLEPHTAQSICRANYLLH